MTLFSSSPLLALRASISSQLSFCVACKLPNPSFPPPLRHSRAGGNLEGRRKHWIPACAGMTVREYDGH